MASRKKLDRQRVVQAEYRDRHKDRFRARRILAAVAKLRELLAKHPPEAGSRWLLSIVSVPTAILDSFDSVEKEFGLSHSDQCAAYIKLGYAANREAVKIAVERGGATHKHDVSAAVVAVGEELAATAPKGA